MTSKLHVCRYLRWKSISLGSDDPLEVTATFAKNQVPYSCLNTGQSWGPDDDLAAPENCDSDRVCFEARLVQVGVGRKG